MFSCSTCVLPVPGIFFKILFFSNYSPLGRVCIVKKYQSLRTLIQWKNGDNKSLMCEAHLLEPLLPFLSTVYKNLIFPIYLLQFLYNLAKHERYTCIMM